MTKASHHAADVKHPARTWFEGKWHEGDIPLLSVESPASWLGQSIFDGARAFDGVAPDLDRHCQRAIASSRYFGMKPPVTAEELLRIAWEGIGKYPRDLALYVRPMIWAGRGLVTPDPNSTKFALVIEAMPMPPFTGFSACLSPFRRPAIDMAPTEAKAGCLYPNVARAQLDAEQRGFDTCIVLDPNGNVAEFCSANLFLAKDGVVATPAVNGTFLNGITRQRVIALLREAGHTVEERRVTFAEVKAADEVFSTGNYSKVKPCTRVEDRNYQSGPIAAKARELYFGFAKRCGPPR
jgi:branched-chain amino acid aminotransferase